MPRLISEIKQLIVAKEKMIEKNKLEKPKAQKEVTDFAEQKLDYDEKIKKEKNEKKSDILGKEQQVVIQKHTSAKLKLSTIEKNETELVKALDDLKVELEKAEKGLEDYGKKRKEGIAMLDREGKKLKVHCDEALRCSLDAEAASVEAEKAAKEGRENDAQGARNNANNSVMATINAAKKAEELIKEITSTMVSTQRNLKAKNFGLMDQEVLVHNQLTKKVQDDFKVLEQMAGKCSGYVKNAEDAAAEATEFANATSVGMALYQGILAKAMENGKKRIEQIKIPMGAKWGLTITEKGALFTRLVNELQSKPTDVPIRSACEKTVEQAQTFLGTTFDKVNALIQDMIDGVKKSTKRVPEEYPKQLKTDIDKLNMLVIQIMNYQEKVKKDYAAADIEFQKLVNAL